MSDARDAGDPPVSRGLLIALGVAVGLLVLYLAWVLVGDPLLTADDDPDAPEDVELTDPADDPAEEDLAEDPDADDADPDVEDPDAEDPDEAEPDPADAEDPRVARGARDPFEQLVSQDAGDGDAADDGADDDAATDDDATDDDADDPDDGTTDDDARTDFEDHTIALLDIGKDGEGSLEAEVEVDGDRETAGAGDDLAGGDLTLWSLDEACALIGDDDRAVEVCVDTASGK